MYKKYRLVVSTCCSNGKPVAGKEHRIKENSIHCRQNLFLSAEIKFFPKQLVSFNFSDGFYLYKKKLNERKGFPQDRKFVSTIRKQKFVKNTCPLGKK